MHPRLSRFNTTSPNPAQRLVDVVSSLLELVSMPFYMCAAFWLLYRDLSFAFVGGLAVVAVIIPLNMRVAVAIGAQTASLMRDRDARMLLCTELLRAVNVLKALGWQHAQGRRINEARRAELRSLRTMKFLDAVCVFLWASTPVLVTLATFAMVVRLLSNAQASSALSAGDVFAAVTLLNMLIYPMNALPWVIKGVMEGRVSAEEPVNVEQEINVELPCRVDPAGVHRSARDSSRNAL